MKVKVCGLKEAENIMAVAGLNPDCVGFIRYERSPRFSAELSADVLKQLPVNIIKTGVFVNEEMPVIDAAIDNFGFEAAQLHGSESPAFCAKLKSKTKVLKAFGVDEGFNFDDLQPYAEHVNCFLFDTKTTSHGGSGKRFNWGLLDNYKLNIPFFLSGGLSLDNLAEIKKIKHPAFYGVDLNSKFETAPGVKDINKLKQAFAILGKDVNKLK